MNKEELITKYGHNNKLEFGFDGYVYLVDLMGGDDDICDAARVSYGKGTRTLRDNRALLRYLVSNHHTSPLEQARLRVHMRLPIYIKNQLQRHRTAHYTSANEYSQRYSIAIDTMEMTSPEEWRLQSTSNRQGSAGLLTDWPSQEQIASNLKDLQATGSLDALGALLILEDLDNARAADLSPGDYLSAREAELQHHAHTGYMERLALGVAREQARKDLPLSTYTEMYWTIDLANLLWLLQLRTDSHAQKEIRELAECLVTIVEEWCPMTWEAFKDYKADAITFSKHEIETLKDLLARTDFQEILTALLNDKMRASYLEGHGLESKTERIGFVHKLKLLGE